MNELTIPSKNFEIILSNKEILKVENEEYSAIDNYLTSGSKGLIRLRSGEWVNPSYVVMIKKINDKITNWAGNLPLYGDKDIQEKLDKKIIKFNQLTQNYERI